MQSGATSELGDRDTAFAGGGQIGYNFQLSPLWVFGIETDIQKTWLKSNASSTTLTESGSTGDFLQTTTENSRELTYLGTLRARAGVTLQPDLLLFMTGGLAYGGAKPSTTLDQGGAGINPPVVTTTGSISDTLVGWTVGGGVEWLFGANVSAKAEYLYYDLGTVNYGTGSLSHDFLPTPFPGSGIGTVATSSSTKFNGSDIRVGINYHLN
jgi:outer membrane immunogenic protein